MNDRLFIGITVESGVNALLLNNALDAVASLIEAK